MVKYRLGTVKLPAYPNCCNLRNHVGEYQSLGVYVGNSCNLGLMEEAPFRVCVVIKMNMLPKATCLDVELLMEHASFNILDEGNIPK